MSFNISKKMIAAGVVLLLLGGGGYSELVTAPEGMVLPVPPGLSTVEAASLPEVWSTVYLNLQLEAGGIGSSDTLFVQAGASGVGLAAIQFGKLHGARVVTTVGSAAKVEFVKKLGADVAVNHHDADIRQVLANGGNEAEILYNDAGGAGVGGKAGAL